MNISRDYLRSLALPMQFEQRFWPVRDGVLIAATVVGVAILSTASLYFTARQIYLEEVRGDLLQRADMAVSFIDADLHQTFFSPEQEGTPEYRRAIAPLRKIMKGDPNIRFVYTVVLQGDDAHFILDATPPGDADGDGVEDHSNIMERYEDPDEEMLVALREGRSMIMNEAKADKWGPVLSAYAPLHDRSGNLIGVVGVDITAQQYAENLRVMWVVACAAVIPTTIFSLLAGMLVFRSQARKLKHTLEQEASQAALERANQALDKSRIATEAATRAKSEFLANMSHEIRTPMTAILGFADVLLGEPGICHAPPERIDAIRTIQRNGKYLLELINDILDLSKIEAGKLEIERLTCSPVQVLADVTSLMRVRASAKNLPLILEYLGDIPVSIQSDPLRLRQVLINLVGNAIKFTATGSVRVVAHLVQRPDKPARFQCDVIDTGVGLTQPQIANLFRPFTQADSSTTRKFGGTGLGLTISKRLAEMLGGDIAISSTLGQGSTFSVSVDAGNLEGVKMLEGPSEAAVPPTSTTSQTATAAVRVNGRILLAEDGRDNQRLIAFILKKAGADVIVVENGQLACDAALAARANGDPFDVILMDMQMPVMDGYEATRRLRSEGYTRPIVALTAHAMAGDEVKCGDAGCDGYLTKPIDHAKFLPTVSRFVSLTHTPPNPEGVVWPIVACQTTVRRGSAVLHDDAGGRGTATHGQAEVKQETQNEEMRNSLWH